MQNNIIFLLALGLLLSSSLEAQLLKKISNRVQDKMEQKLEDKVVEEVSEEIARRAMRPINNAIDQMLKEAYKEEYGEDFDESAYDGDPEKRAEALGNVLSSMYGEVELPDSYEFSYKSDISVKDYNKKKAENVMTMYTAENAGYFGFSQAREDDSFMIFDIRNDQAVIFNKKEKSVMAIKGVMKMATAFTSSAEMSEYHMSVTKSGLTKKVAGYACDGYGYETEEDTGEFYMSTDLPFDWGSSFASVYEEMFTDFYENDADYSGMLMYSEAVRKKDGKSSIWEVTDIQKISQSVDCSEYQLINPFSGK